MRAGQFWPIPLSNGRYACGRVLQIARDYGEASTKTFLAGLMNWSGDGEPCSHDLVGKQVLATGGAHIKTITHTGASIIGIRELQSDGISVSLSLDSAKGPNCILRKGFESLRLANQEEQKTLQVFSTWGYGVINLVAEKHFVTE